MKKVALLAILVLSSCAGKTWKPGPVRTAEPTLRRGWSYVESEESALKLSTGVTPVSYSAPLVLGEKLIFGSERFGLTVLGKRSGQVLWQKTFAEPVTAAPFAENNRIFVGTAAGDIYQFNLESGQENWKVALSAAVHGTFLEAFDRLYVATVDEALHALDPATGKILWTYRRPAFSGTSIRGGGNPAAIGGKIWMGFSDGALVSIDPQNGAQDSERIFRDNLKFTDLHARVLGWKEGLLVSTYDGKFRSLRKDGSLSWEFPAGSARSPLLAESGVVYLPGSDGNVYAINADTGKELWRYGLKRGVPTALALVSRAGAKALLVTGSEEKILLLNPENGKLLDESSLGRGSGSYSPVAVDDDGKTFYVLSAYSRIYQYHLN